MTEEITNTKEVARYLNIHEKQLYSLIKAKSEVYTHLDAGRSILSRETGTGIATTTVLQLLGLSFIPIIKESFDMVLDQPAYFHKGTLAFIDILRLVLYSNGDERLRLSECGENTLCEDPTEATYEKVDMYGIVESYSGLPRVVRC
jgi:hypothetical protein